MENLTIQQQEIIQSLKEQFAQINSFLPKMTDNPLLNYKLELNQDKRLEQGDRETIVSSNKAIELARVELISRDEEYLNDLLLNSDLEDMIDVEIRVDSIILYKSNYSLWIHYDIERPSTRSYNYLDSITILGDIKISYKGVTYNSIKDVIASDTFKNNFKDMLNFRSNA